MEAMRRRKILCSAILLIGLIVFTGKTGHKAATADENWLEYYSFDYFFPVEYEIRHEVCEITAGFYSAYEEYWEKLNNYEGAVIPDAQTAISVCNAIFRGGIAQCYGAETWIPQYVVYDPEAEVWCVDFWEEERGFTLGGGSISIVIQKWDGKIVNVGYGGE